MIAFLVGAGIILVTILVFIFVPLGVGMLAEKIMGYKDDNAEETYLLGAGISFGVTVFVLLSWFTGMVFTGRI